MNIYVGNLSYETTADELQQMFAEYGAVEHVNLITDGDSGRSKGFAFIEMAKQHEAEEAIKKLNETSFNGRNLTINLAQPRDKKSRSRSRR